MSKQAFLEFYETTFKIEELKEKIKVITSLQELVKLGSRYGYSFTAADIEEASAFSAQENGQANLLQASETELSKKLPLFYHYEFEFSQIKGFEEIVCELNKLKIKPCTVDINLYKKTFRKDDFNFASISPASPEFNVFYHEIMDSCFDSKKSLDESEYSQRQFHLINLDIHVEHPLYENYFIAKVRILKLLENFFGFEMRFSGSLWYPPKAYRVWHTNEAQPGWRMYLIDFDDFEQDGNCKSFFRYLNPQNKSLVTLDDKPKLVRFFKIEQDSNKLFWHCIVNATNFNRWSFGFVVADTWMNKLGVLSGIE